VKIHSEVWGGFFRAGSLAVLKPEYISTNPWFRQWHLIAKDISVMLEQELPCSSRDARALFCLETEDLIVLQAECIAAPRNKLSPDLGEYNRQED